MDMPQVLTFVRIVNRPVEIDNFSIPIGSTVLHQHDAKELVYFKLIADNAKKAGVDTVVFDRGGFLYHGRIKALADSAREAGLKF